MDQKKGKCCVERGPGKKKRPHSKPANLRSKKKKNAIYEKNGFSGGERGGKGAQTDEG